MLRSQYQVREVAQALVAVGSGATYTDAARRVRSGFWGPAMGPGRRLPTTVEGGQTVADWLNQFGPVVAGPWAETNWPECIVLDSTEFVDTDPRTGQRRQLFAVLAAWGYPPGDSKGRLWRIEARPTDTNADWAEFLAALPGRPVSVVCDRDNAIIGGVQLRWGRGQAAVPYHLCEHHLYENAKEALHRDGVRAFGHPLHQLLNSAFTDQVSWQAFALAARSSGLAEITRWVDHWDRRMTRQTARRSELPPHYSTGALEPRLRELRGMLERRKWTFRNRTRMNLLLELMRLHLNRLDDPGRFAASIRSHLDANGGDPARPRKLADPIVFDPVSGDRRYTLRG